MLSKPWVSLVVDVDVDVDVDVVAARSLAHLLSNSLVWKKFQANMSLKGGGGNGFVAMASMLCCNVCVKSNV